MAQFSEKYIVIYMAQFTESEPLPKKKTGSKKEKKPKKPKKPKASASASLPHPKHTIDVLNDSDVFAQPGDSDYEFSLAYQIRTKILELETEGPELSEANQFIFDLLRLKVIKYHTAYIEHHVPNLDYVTSYQKMKEQDDARRQLIQCIVGQAEYERRRLAQLDHAQVFNDEEHEEEHGSVGNVPMAEGVGVRNTTDLFVGEEPVKSSMDGIDTVCAICTENLTKNDFGDVYAIESENERYSERGLKCGHKYHRRCINSWIKVHMNCPLCKSKIVKLHLANEEDPEGSEKNSRSSGVGGAGGAENRPNRPKGTNKNTFGKNKTRRKNNL